MNRSATLFLVAIVLILVGGGIYLGTHKSKSTTNNSSSQPAASTPSNGSGSSPESTSTTIKYTDSGFSPATATVTAGSTVTFMNETGSLIQVDSNPHPVHTDNPELNVGAISPHQSKSVTLSAKGSWGIHNHLDPGVTARITVQ